MNTKTTKNDFVFDVQKIKNDFPILQREINGHRLVYLDSGASTQKPIAVINAHADYYNRINSNIHRGLHTLAEEATSAYEKTRSHVAKFIGGVKTSEVIFTSGTTESINLVAYTWGEANISEGDEIVLTDMEHHANLVPWVMLAKRKNAIIKRIPITDDGRLDLTDIDTIITEKTKIVSVTHMSNVLGTVNPVKEIAQVAHQHGAVILADGAQSAPHIPIDVLDMDVDFFAFSAHKMLGATGVGVLYGKEYILDKMPPFNMGGEMISEVSFDRITWAELPHKFEAGTPNIAGVVTFDTALTYLENIGMDNIHAYETKLTAYAIDKLTQINGLKIQGPNNTLNRGGAVSFTDKDLHPHDISTFLDSKGVAIRAGHHCAQTLMKRMGTIATARASLYIYNDEADIDALHDALIAMRRYFGHE